MSKASDISQLVALRVVKVTINADQWEVGNADMATHDHVDSYGDAIH